MEQVCDLHSIKDEGLGSHIKSGIFFKALLCCLFFRIPVFCVVLNDLFFISLCSNDDDDDGDWCGGYTHWDMWRVCFMDNLMGE